MSWVSELLNLTPASQLVPVPGQDVAGHHKSQQYRGGVEKRGTEMGAVQNAEEEEEEMRSPYWQVRGHSFVYKLSCGDEVLMDYVVHVSGWIRRDFR